MLVHKAQLTASSSDGTCFPKTQTILGLNSLGNLCQLFFEKASPATADFAHLLSFIFYFWWITMTSPKLCGCPSGILGGILSYSRWDAWLVLGSWKVCSPLPLPVYMQMQVAWCGMCVDRPPLTLTRLWANWGAGEIYYGAFRESLKDRGRSWSPCSPWGSPYNGNSTKSLLLESLKLKQTKLCL